MTKNQVKEILALLKGLPVKSVKFNGLELELYPTIGQSSSSKVLSAAEMGITTERMPTEDELLYASSGYDPKVEAEPPTD